MTTAPSLRLALRAGVLAVPLATVGLAHPALAATPVTWNDPPPMSLLMALLIFAGIPLALMAVISLLVLAPSLVRGDRQQRGVASWTEPQWFGGPGDAIPAGRQSPHAEVEAGPKAEEHEHVGGASARW